MADDILSFYQARAARHETAAADCRRTANRLTAARAVFFTAAVTVGVLAERASSGWLWGGAGVLVAAFAGLVAWHRRVRARCTEYEELAALNREGVARAMRDWSRLPARPAPAGAADHGYAGDLDVFGAESLAQLLGPHGSAGGAGVLDRWLLEPAAPAEILARQEGVRELAALAEWRERLALHARRTRHVRDADLERFLRWAEAPAGTSRAALTVLPWLLPLLLWAPVIAGIWIPLPPLWIIGAVGIVAVGGTLGRAASREMREAFGREAIFTDFPALLATIAGQEFTAPMLVRLREVTGGGESPAPAQIARLRRIMSVADARFSSIYPVLKFGLLWDLHVLRALLDWKRDCGTDVRAWLAAAAEAEALAVLATLAHDEPEWCFPEIDAHATAFSASALGHPLIAAAQRVANDVSVGPAGTFLLVTGSNMAGKSTLLRSIGLNAVLAQAGAPCCARSLHMPPLRLGTSIRVQDSLSRGVSYFMAELQRLKQVVDAADAHPGAFMFLLDEILHGTNTAERRIAAREVIAHLIATGAIGAITTHDLELATSADLLNRAALVHFTEQFTSQPGGGERMTFDYILRPGLASSTNALKLVELVGLRRQEHA